MNPGIYEGQRTTFKNWFFPSTVEVPGIELGLSGLVARVFTELSPAHTDSSFDYRQTHQSWSRGLRSSRRKSTFTLRAGFISSTRVYNPPSSAHLTGTWRSPKKQPESPVRLNTTLEPYKVMHKQSLLWPLSLIIQYLFADCCSTYHMVESRLALNMYWLYILVANLWTM